MNAYEEKLEARRERLAAKAVKNRSEADARANRAMNHARNLQGEPVKVGHHSERKHRNLLASMDRDMSKASDLYKQADRLESRADSVGKAGISSDDPEAVVKLERKIESLERNQQFMKDANVAHRKAGRPGPDDAAGWLAVEESLGVEAGYFDSHRSFIRCWPSNTPFESFSLSNNNANIKRCKARLAQIRKQWKTETVESAPVAGVKLIENMDENRIQLIFDGKPEANIRTLLKQHGFRWSPRNGAWQRHLNGNGVYAASQVIVKLQTL